MASKASGECTPPTDTSAGLALVRRDVGDNGLHQAESTEAEEAAEEEEDEEDEQRGEEDEAMEEDTNVRTAVDEDEDEAEDDDGGVAKGASPVVRAKEEFGGGGEGRSKREVKSMLSKCWGTILECTFASPPSAAVSKAWKPEGRETHGFRHLSHSPCVKQRHRQVRGVYLKRIVRVGVRR